ncbi:acetyl-CoA carboxylase biotin carboxylase subunit [Ureibacillus chungkukjangi]|uniref:acetyl-CoA carboxylase biotin carboxylase subunit n=1 Tax=Ureibacillus chungkukjangi TaxID=1202712 RepID=UPI00203AC3FF|nr:acetyl-CoA carboxylase biotin carboxylase subunit [Ureibacillus chungkukjangi]MCM3388643.1 acetyl-CoA carboxylase biotin carboxylase subunit [Ureibacillus chungkukjangi]
MFKKVLIANRGEIARRIIRTCNRLGIETVAIYSEADAISLHVKEATESFCIGKPPVAQSYLNIDAILDVAKQTGADAVHPGYGLLSENAAFAKRVEEVGITFIGPKSQVIQAMGSKLEARKTMQQAGVPIVQGVNEPIEDTDEAEKIAEEIGFPVMLKASAGGGGIGMQLVNNEEELRKAFEGNQKRAQSFFGDGTMFIEKFIAEPHHVEVQVLADEHGNVVPVYERECSIQRRNQKVVEEAPSPFISEETRKKMLDAAVDAAKHIGYTNAGTIEFLVDRNQNFYFLEMNTRLQVEHPVTEEITGLDLVEQQLKVANGEKLAFKREDIQKKGHAIEVRIYAEHPVTFFPSPGKITKLVLPEGEGIRHEVAVETGSDVTPFYDPMIGKLVVYGATRNEACVRLADALSNYVIEGIKTNIPMLLETVTHEQFLKGITTTKFVEEYYLPNATSVGK